MSGRDRRSALFSQYLPGFFQVAARGPGHFGIFEPKPVQRLHHFGRDDKAREPLVVRGYDAGYPALFAAFSN